jgi:hypothetical protein
MKPHLRLVVQLDLTPGANMSVPRTVADVMEHHVTLELESLDRVYLNVYQPKLQTPKAVFHFLRQFHGEGAVSSRQMKARTEGFLQDIDRYAVTHGIPIITFEKGQRKEDVAAEYLRHHDGASDAILFIGKAQEKARTFRTEGRRNARGETYPWIVESTAMVNQYYFYGCDEDLGPFFIKYSSYFPYGAKLCFNGHEYLKRQLAKEKIGYEELANGILSCDNPKRMQQLADRLSPAHLARFWKKWQRRLPCPFGIDERCSGYDYEVSMSQVEFALTQVVDRPVHGRIFFEEVIRENLDLGRPENIQLIFDRRVTKRTPGQFRTRVVREGVIPSLRIDYKCNSIKQYFKEGRAVRTELTVHDPYDFGVARKLENLSELRKRGFATTRRVLDVQKTSQDFAMSEELFREVTGPREVEGQRASALKFGDPVVFALFSVLVLFRLLPCGFRSRDLREHVATLLGDDPSQWTQGRLTYQLRRLRLHGLIERVKSTHRYVVTERGYRVALWLSRCQSRVLRPSLGEVLSSSNCYDQTLKEAIERFDAYVVRYFQAAQLQTAA